MTQQQPHVLAVADCEGIEEMVVDLRRHRYSVRAATTEAEALSGLEGADVVLVDLDLGDVDGLTLCKRLRKVSDVAMIAFCAQHGFERVLALEAGCDDCITKPYPSRELMARLEALLRRVWGRPQPLLSVGRLEIDSGLRQVRVDGSPVELTRKEFELLALLAAEPDKVFSRSELLRRVWGYDEVDAEVTSLASRTIDTHLSSIRKKLGSSDWVVTVRGIGFRFGEETLDRTAPDPGLRPFTSTAD